MQTRSFCYISDMIDALTKLMNSDFQGPINIGNPKKVTIKQLAEIIRQKINPDLEFIYKSLPQDDPLQRSPSIDLANKHLNWFPKVCLEEGLNKTIKFMRDL